MPPTRQQRYTCQISIGSTRKSPGKNSADPPDVIRDSEWRYIKGDTYTGEPDDGQTRLQNVKQEKSGSPEPEQFKRGTCTQTNTERTGGPTHPHRVQQENNLKSVSSGLEQLKGGVNTGVTDDDLTRPLSAQQTESLKSASPELGQLEGDTHRNADRTGDRWTHPQSQQQDVDPQSVSPEIGQNEGGTDKTEDGWTHPQSLHQKVNSQSASPELGQFEGVDARVTDDERTRPVSVQNDNLKSVDPEYGKLKGGTSAGRKDDRRTRPQNVKHEENGVDDEGSRLQSSHWKNSSESVSPKLRQSYLDFFDKADIFNLGYLTVHQFRDAVFKLGFSGTTLQIAAMFADLNPNDDLVITLDAFMNEMCKSDSRKWTQKDLTDIFHCLDADGDGLITEKDIMTSLECQGKVKMDDTIKHMILEYDFDRDGALSLQDFLKGCQRNQRK